MGWDGARGRWSKWMATGLCDVGGSERSARSFLWCGNRRQDGRTPYSSISVSLIEKVLVRVWLLFLPGEQRQAAAVHPTPGTRNGVDAGPDTFSRVGPNRPSVWEEGNRYYLALSLANRLSLYWVAWSVILSSPLRVTIFLLETQKIGFFSH